MAPYIPSKGFPFFASTRDLCLTSNEVVACTMYISVNTVLIYKKATMNSSPSISAGNANLAMRWKEPLSLRFLQASLCLSFMTSVGLCWTITF